MGNGYAVPAQDSLDKLAQILQDARRRLRELESLDGTQLGVVPAVDVDSGSNSGFTINTSYSSIVTLSLTVPENRSQALITASGYGHLSNNAATTAFIGYMRFVIDGTGGPVSQTSIASSAVWSPVACFYARRLTGLTPGETVTIQLQARLDTGSTAAGTEARQVANATATGMFLR